MPVVALEPSQPLKSCSMPPSLEILMLPMILEHFPLFLTCGACCPFTACVVSPYISMTNFNGEFPSGCCAWYSLLWVSCSVTHLFLPQLLCSFLSHYPGTWNSTTFMFLNLCLSPWEHLQNVFLALSRSVSSFHTTLSYKFFSLIVLGLQTGYGPWCWGDTVQLLSIAINIYALY